MQLYDFLEHETLTHLYQSMLKQLLEHPMYVASPRGMKIHEITNATVILDPYACDLDFTITGAPERQPVYEKYKTEELEWYLSCNTLASSAPSKFWNKLADSAGHITSNYGSMILKEPIYPDLEGDLTAFQKVIATLQADPDSRQAIMHYNRPEHCYVGNKDFPCTMYSQFFLRNGYLNMTTYQRSCDVIKGLVYDIPWSCHVMKMVLEELNKIWPDLDLGEFHHVIGSLHLYEKDFELAKRIIQ